MAPARESIATPVRAEWPLAVTWPGPDRPAPRLIVPAVLAAGVLAAIAVPTDRPGIGWFVAAVVIAIAIRVVTVQQPVATADGPSRIRWGTVTFALMAVPVIRDAGWLDTLCVSTAFATGSLAVAGGRSLRAMLVGMIAVPVAAVRGLPWARKAVRSSATRARTVAAVVGTGALLLVFGGLLASGDEAFADALAAVVPILTGIGWLPRTIVFGTAALLVVGCSYTAASRPVVTEPTTRRTLRTLEWGLPAAALAVLYGGFVLVQLRMLFGGRGYVLHTTGLSAAKYARSGFWQLAVATVLTLILLGLAARFSAADTVPDRVRRRLLLGPLAVLTLVIVASSLTRMWAYQQAYGFTVLRLLVEVCELWVGVGYLLVIIAGLRRDRATWLPRTVIASAVAGLLVIAALDPERFVAERDVDRYAETGKIDTWYLASLSADATPALAKLPDALRRCTLAWQAAHLKVDDGPLSWNLARSRVTAPAAECG